MKVKYNAIINPDFQYTVYVPFNNENVFKNSTLYTESFVRWLMANYGTFYWNQIKVSYEVGGAKFHFKDESDSNIFLLTHL